MTVQVEDFWKFKEKKVEFIIHYNLILNITKEFNTACVQIFSAV